MENRALGKGLSALIPDKVAESPTEDSKKIKTDQIKFNSLQPRKHYDDEKLSELILSIQENGVLQPILVREKEGQYEVVAGERRLRAAQSVGLEEVPVIIRNVSDQEALVIALVENIQREELNPIEEALAFKKLIEDFAYTQDAIAKAVGKERSTVSNVLRLLKLPENIQASISSGKISEGHARALLSIDDEKKQQEAFHLCLEKGISVRELEQIAKEGLKQKSKTKTKKPKDYNLTVLEEDLQKTLGTKVSIVASKKRGKIVIEYYSNEDLDRLIGTIKR